MPQLYNIDRFNFQLSGNVSGVRETTQGNIVLNGVYHTLSSLTPLNILETPGTNANTMWALNHGAPNFIAGFASAPPMAMLSGIQNWNLWIGQCHYYASGYGQIKPIVNDVDRGFTWTIAPRLQSADGQNPGAFQSGTTGGFGLIKSVGWWNQSTSNTSYPLTQIHLTRNSTDQLLSTQLIGENQTTFNAPILSGNIPGFIRLDPSTGIRYMWKLPVPSNSTSFASQSTTGGYSYGTIASTTQFFQNNQKALIIDATSASYYTSLYGTLPENARIAGLITTVGTTAYSSLNTNSAAIFYKHFIYATAIFVYYCEFTAAFMQSGAAASVGGWYLRKMNYSGTETTIASYTTIQIATYGYTLPSQPFAVTNTSATVIYPLAGGNTTLGSAVGSTTLQFMKLVIDIPGGSETVVALTNGAANQANANVIYNRMALSGATTASIGVIGSNDWRSFSTFRTWVVQGVTGVNYLNFSYENTYYHYGSYGTRTMTTVPSSTMNSASTGYPAFKVRDAFSIWTYQLDTGLTTASIVGNTDMGLYLPRWYMPVTSTGLVQYVSCAWDALNDIIVKFNESTYKWDWQANLNYRADQVGVDSQGRVWATSCVVGGTQLSPRTGAVLNYGSDAVILEGANLPLAVNVTLPSSAYVYSGTTINTTFTMNVTNFVGTRVASNVLVQLTGGLQFTDTTTQQYITTSSSADTTTSINVVNGASSRINTTIMQVL